MPRLLITLLASPTASKSPPTYTRGPLTATAATPVSVPLPRLLHVLPSQRARWRAGTPLASVKLPPTYNAPPAAARAVTSAQSGLTWLPTPLPTADQLLPSHLARLLAGTLPAWAKWPPTYKSDPTASRAYTCGYSPGRPLMPLPRLLQVAPSQRATLLAGWPPASQNSPPTYRLLPTTARALMALLVPSLLPVPSVLQALPFQRAMKCAGAPPAWPKRPATYRSEPLRARQYTSLLIPSLAPLPNALQVVPSHLAMLCAATLPAWLKYPPTYTVLPLTTSPLT